MGMKGFSVDNAATIRLHGRLLRLARTLYRGAGYDFKGDATASATPLPR
jgi:hypothetical protein